MKKIPKSLIKKSSCWKPSLHEGYTKRSDSWFTIRSKQFRTLDSPSKDIATENIRCEKIFLCPKLKERNILLSWLDAYRIVYNMTVLLSKKDNKLSKYDARKQIKEQISNNEYLSKLFKKIKVPVHTLDNAVFDVLKARKTAFANLKAKNIKFFRLRYKRKSHHQKILVLEPSVFNKEGTGFKSMMKNIYPSKPIKTTKDTRLSYNSRTKKFTLYVPQDKKVKDKVQRSNVCALDPGIRTFQTLYSPSGIAYQFGDEKGIIDKNINRIEKVRDLKDKSWHGKYVGRLREKLKNRIADLHWKTAFKVFAVCLQ